MRLNLVNHGCLVPIKAHLRLSSKSTRALRPYPGHSLPAVGCTRLVQHAANDDGAKRADNDKAQDDHSIAESEDQNLKSTVEEEEEDMPHKLRSQSAPPIRVASGKEDADTLSEELPRSFSHEDLTYHDRQVRNLVSFPSRAALDGEDLERQGRPSAAARTTSAAALSPSQATRPLLLTFDAFNTLFTPKEPIGKQYCDLARQFGLEFEEKAVMASFKKAFKSMSRRHPNYGAGSKTMDPQKWWTTVITDTLTPLLPSHHDPLPPTSPSASPKPTVSDSSLPASETPASTTFETPASPTSETPTSPASEAPTNTSTTADTTSETPKRPFVKTVKIPRPTLPPNLAETLYTHFATSAAYTLYPDIFPFLQHIGTASYSAAHWAPRRTMLGILSNSDPRVRSILDSFPPSAGGPIPIHPSLFPPRYMPFSRKVKPYTFGPAHFAFACLSYEREVAKPDRRIFDKAVRMAQRALMTMHPVARGTRTGLELLGDVRGEFHCLHVGDDVSMDVVGALRAGWDVVLLDRKMKTGIGKRVVEVPEDKWDEEQNWEEKEERTEGGNEEGNEDGKEKRVRKVEVTVVNSLMQLRYVITKERLEGPDSPWSQVGKPVWLEPGKEVIRTRPMSKRDMKGRRIADSGRGDGTKILL